MLKAISTITNALGALNYKGMWNASTNSPALASGVGTKGDYYVVSVAGATTLDGISNWGVGDWAAYNGSAWQRVEGGADGNFVNLSVSSTSTLSGLTASTALALDASKNVVSVTNTGTGSNVLATTPTLSGDVTLSTGNLVIGTAGKGIDFSITSHPAGMTSELLSDYEEGTWTPTVEFGGASVGVTYSATRQGTYTKVGRAVTIQCQVVLTSKGSSTGAMSVSGLPYTPHANTTAATVWIDTSVATLVAPATSLIFGSNPAVNFFFVSAGSQSNYTNTQAQDTSNIVVTATYFV